MTEGFNRVAVLGGGAWGTALAILLAAAGRDVIWWTRNEAVVAAVASTGQNTVYLPGVALPVSLSATTDRSAVAAADAVVCVIPTQHLRTELPMVRPVMGARAAPIALCCKGIEASTGKFVHDILADVWPEAAASILSGPSFAADVARGLPTAVTLADADISRGARWQVTLSTPTFRPYLSDDLIGVALGGAVKNVLAIACGVVEGKGLGESAKAALMARGFAETLRLAVAVGARSDTLHGLSGLGDIILTCSSRQSRNYSLGVEIGQGREATDIMATRNTVAEGAATAPVLADIARRSGVDMPIADAVAQLVSGEVSAEQMVGAIMSRPIRHRE